MPQIVIVVLSLGLALLMWVAQRRMAQTTLRAPLIWATGALLGLSAVAWWQAGEDRLSLAAQELRYAAGVATLCPIMAVLGAKRPQDRGWQWVVATMWLVAVWPAVQAVAMSVGPRLELFIAWRIFLWGLILLGPLNYVATRFWLAALCVAAGQMLLLAEPLGWTITEPWQLPTALGLFAAAATWVSWRVRSADSDTLGARWHFFRDYFGAFWGLRVLQRVNQTAELRNWSVRLDWRGLRTLDGETAAQPAPEDSRELEQTFDTLLRRFL